MSKNYKGEIVSDMYEIMLDIDNVWKKVMSLDKEKENNLLAVKRVGQQLSLARNMLRRIKKQFRRDYVL